jgi:hypothetical protein
MAFIWATKIVSSQTPFGLRLTRLFPCIISITYIHKHVYVCINLVYISHKIRKKKGEGVPKPPQINIYPLTWLPTVANWPRSTMLMSDERWLTHKPLWPLGPHHKSPIATLQQYYIQNSKQIISIDGFFPFPFTVCTQICMYLFMRKEERKLVSTVNKPWWPNDRLGLRPVNQPTVNSHPTKPLKTWSRMTSRWRTKNWGFFPRRWWY